MTRIARRSFCIALRQSVARSPSRLESLKSEALKGARKGDIGLIVKSIRSVKKLKRLIRFVRQLKWVLLKQVH